MDMQAIPVSGAVGRACCVALVLFEDLKAFKAALIRFFRVSHSASLPPTGMRKESDA